MPSAPVKKE